MCIGGKEHVALLVFPESWTIKLQLLLDNFARNACCSYKFWGFFPLYVFPPSSSCFPVKVEFVTKKYWWVIPGYHALPFTYPSHAASSNTHPHLPDLNHPSLLSNTSPHPNNRPPYLAPRHVVGVCDSVVDMWWWPRDNVTTTNWCSTVVGWCPGCCSMHAPLVRLSEIVFACRSPKQGMCRPGAAELVDGVVWMVWLVLIYVFVSVMNADCS